MQCAARRTLRAFSYLSRSERPLKDEALFKYTYLQTIHTEGKSNEVFTSKPGRSTRVQQRPVAEGHLLDGICEIEAPHGKPSHVGAVHDLFPRAPRNRAHRHRRGMGNVNRDLLGLDAGLQPAHFRVLPTATEQRGRFNSHISHLFYAAVHKCIPVFAGKQSALLLQFLMTSSTKRNAKDTRCPNKWRNQTAKGTTDTTSPRARGPRTSFSSFEASFLRSRSSSRCARIFLKFNLVKSTPF